MIVPCARHNALSGRPHRRHEEPVCDPLCEQGLLSKFRVKMEWVLVTNEATPQTHQ